MRREELLAKGYTEEQVTDILNTFHGINKENESLKSELQTSKGSNEELQKQLNAINEANLTEQEKIAKKEAEIEKNLANAKRIYNTAKAKDILAGLDVDDTLINSLVSDDENVTINNATLLKTKLETVKDLAVKKTREEIANLNVKPTPTNIPQEPEGMTVDKFNKMTMTEQAMWKRENADEYNNLFN